MADEDEKTYISRSESRDGNELQVSSSDCFLFLTIGTLIHFPSILLLRGAIKKKKTEKVGLLDQPVDPPLPVIWSKKNGKQFQCLFCILDYSEHFDFS